LKRFTETLKWTDPWFRRLSAPAKLLWFYAVDHCDNIGIVELDLEFVGKDCGTKITEAHVAELGSRLESIGESKFFLPKFIKFQYGQLSASCPAHKKVIQAVEEHCLLQDLLGYHYPNARLPVAYRKGKEEDSTGRGEEGSGEKPPTTSKSRCTAVEAIEYANSIQLSASDGQWFFDKCEGCGWKNNGSPILDWKATIRAWKTGGYLPSQKRAEAAKPRTYAAPLPKGL